MEQYGPFMLIISTPHGTNIEFFHIRDMTLGDHFYVRGKGMLNIFMKTLARYNLAATDWGQVFS